MQRPLPGEYNPFFQNYFDLIPEGDLLELLQQNSGEIIEVFHTVAPEMEDYAYAEGKWTIKEMLNHIIDAERIFGYRSLVAARMDATTNLMSFDENHYADHVDVSSRTLKDLIEEFKTVRASSFFLMSSINDDQSSFKARNGDYNFTARAGISFMIGHTLHHLKVLKERYL